MSATLRRVLRALRFALIGFGALAASAVFAQALPAAWRPAVAPEAFDALLRQDFYGVYIGGLKVGWTSQALRRETVDGEPRFVSELDTQMRMVNAGVTIASRSTERVWFDAQPPYAMRRFSTEVVQNDDRQLSEGRFTPDGFSVSTTTRSGTQTRDAGAMDFTLVDNEVLSLWIKGGTYGAAAQKGDAPITSRHLALDELRVRAERHRIQAEATHSRQGVAITEVEIEVSVPHDQTRFTVGVDRANGRTLMMRNAAYEMRLEPEATAKTGGVATDLYELGKVRIDRALGEGSRIERLVLAVEGKGQPPLEDGPNQTMQRDAAGLLWRITLTMKPSRTTPVTAEDEREATLDTLIHPHGKANVQALAKEALGNDGAALTREQTVARVVRFVNRFIKPSYTANPLTVDDILAKREGDCSEYARLTATLLRALGIPTREVAGLAYAGDKEKSFELHAWNEVVLEDAAGAKYWHAIDATFNRTAVTPHYISFGANPDAQSAGIAAALQQFKLRVVELQRR